MKKQWMPSWKVFFWLGLILLLSACQTQQTTGTALISVGSTIPATPQVDCPATGQGRAMDLVPLPSHGTDSTIIYDYTGGNSPDTIKAYNIVTGQKKTIYTVPAGIGGPEHVPGENKGLVQVSADGEWVLFVAANKLQAIRVDGQDLQTLYCTDSSHPFEQFKWSSDQTHIAFILSRRSASPGPNLDTLYLLDTTTGSIQTEDTFNTSIQVPEGLIWLDATHIYIEIWEGNNPNITPSALYLLDITQGATHMQTVWSDSNSANFYASLSADGKRLYISDAVYDTNIVQSTIYAHSPTGMGMQVIYHNQTSEAGYTGPVGICAANNVVLFSINGLYKVNPDGTGLTKLFVSPGNVVDINCGASNESISRDGTQYACLLIYSGGSDEELDYADLNGGSATQFANTGGAGFVHIIGWTTL